MAYANVVTEKKGAVGTVWLNRPAVLNPLSAAHLEEIGSAVSEVDADPHVKVIVLAGKGRAFSAGADLKELSASAAGDPGEARTRPNLGHRALRSLYDARSITVGAAQGYAVGGGLSLIMACDLRLAAKGAVFFIPEVDLGLPYFWGSTPLLVEAVGLCKAKELILTCDRIDADEALHLGLINRVVPANRLIEETYALAERIASKPPVALREVKKMSHTGLFRRLEEYDAKEDGEIMFRALSDRTPNPHREGLLRDKLKK
jgi:enoyl-CoA hydratase/carnithine racemase